MDQPTATFKLLDSLQQMTLFDSDQISVIIEHLGMAYAVGYDEGHRQKCEGKEVVQLTKSGNLVHTYNSIAEASKSLNVTHQAITWALRHHSLCKGHIFELAEK